MWTKVNGYENMPLGTWLVEVERPDWGLYFHTASVNAACIDTVSEQSGKTGVVLPV